MSLVATVRGPIDTSRLGAIVDLAVIGQDRFTPRIQRVAERTSINIAVATAVYTFSDGY